MSGTQNDGRFAYDGLERAIHEKARLGILTCLVGQAEGLLFTDLKELCSLSDGNLNRHLKVLAEEGLVEIWKGTSGGRSRTMCQVTQSGRERFLNYLDALQKVLEEGARAVGESRSVDPE